MRERTGRLTGLSQLAAEALHRDPAQQAVEFAGRWHSWGDLARIAAGIDAALAASGIAADAPVAFVPRNHPSSLAALLALIAAGRTIRMVYAFQSPAGIARDLAARQVAAVLAGAEDFTPEVRDVLAAKGLAAVALGDADAAPLAGFEHATAETRDPGPPRIEILTSGTTGPPKPFAVSYALIETHFLSSPLARQHEGEAGAAPPFLLYFPLGNISGLYSTLPMLLRGQRVALLERFTLAGWHDYVLRYRPAHTGLPPSALQQVLDADIPRDDLASIQALGTGAAPLDPAVQRAFEDRYGIPVLLSYGATEFAGPVAMMTAELHARWGRAKLGSVGRALPGVSLRVVDPDSGAVLPPGAEGLLEVIAPRVGPGWIRTSDLALIDADGFLFHRGRADGAIVRGGFKIVPESVEAALRLHPAVSEAVVVGLPDRRLGAIPAAAIRLAPGVPEPSVAELETHLRGHVLAPHVPAKWLFCEDLPRTPSLKTDRPAIRRLFVAD